MADDFSSSNFLANSNANLQIVQQTTLLPNAFPYYTPKTPKTVEVLVTAYSPTTWETDEDPFITASGTYVRDGTVANNSLPFGTRIMLPEIFPDKVFVVEDRMHWRKSNNHVDVLFLSRQEALNFGAKITKMEILSN